MPFGEFFTDLDRGDLLERDMSLEIRKLNVSGPRDYEASSRQLETELGCWEFREYFPGTHHQTSNGRERLCIMAGVATLNGQNVEVGHVIDLNGEMMVEVAAGQRLEVRRCYLDSLILKEGVWRVVRRSLPDNCPLSGFWRSYRNRTLSELPHDKIYFGFKQGPLADGLFQRNGATQLHSVNVRQLLCFSFDSVKPDSMTAQEARATIEMGEKLSQLKSEEYFERRGGQWQRWLPSDDGTHSLLEQSSALINADKLVDAVLSNIWKNPEYVCQWMHTVPREPNYSVPHLQIRGRTISERLMRKWRIRSLCSHSQLNFEPQDLYVEIDPEAGRVRWVSNEAREMASWSFRYEESTDTIELNLIDVYD